MINTLYNSEIVITNYDDELQLLDVIWKKNPDSEEYRKMFGVVIEFSEKKHIRYFLSDMRKEGLVKLEDVRWLNREVLHRAIEHKLERIALIVEETIFGGIYGDVVRKKLEKSPIQVMLFGDPVSARAWLLK
jgi:hypothetical protein